MNIVQLRTFAEVYKHGNLSRAAEALHLTQPAVTLHIQKLEKAFGARLFRREKTKIQPTSCGKILYEHAAGILRHLEEAKIQMSHEYSGVSGALRVSASTTPGEFLVPELAAQFVKKYPDVHVELSVMDSQAVYRCLQKQSCDFGFVGSIQKGVKLKFRKVADDEIVLACPKNFRGGADGKISIKKLEGEKFVMREEGSGTMKSVVDLFRRHHLHFPPHAVSAVIESGHAQLAAIEAGLGIGFVSSLALRSSHEGWRVKSLRLKEVKLVRPLYMVYSPARAQSKLHKEFIRFAEKRGLLKT